MLYCYSCHVKVTEASHSDAARLRTSCFQELTAKLEPDVTKFEKCLAEGTSTLALFEDGSPEQPAAAKSKADQAVRNSYIKTLTARVRMGQHLKGFSPAEAPEKTTAEAAAAVSEVQLGGHQVKETVKLEPAEDSAPASGEAVGVVEPVELGAATKRLPLRRKTSASLAGAGDPPQAAAGEDGEAKDTGEPKQDDKVDDNEVDKGNDNGADGGQDADKPTGPPVDVKDKAEAAEAPAGGSSGSAPPSTQSKEARQAGGDVIDVESSTTALMTFAHQNLNLLPHMDFKHLAFPDTMLQLLNSMLDMNTADDIITAYKCADKQNKTFDTFVAGLSQSVQDMKRHLRNSKTAADRQVTQSKRASDKAEVDKHQKAAMDAASKVRQRQEQTMKVAEIFKIIAEQLTEVPAADSVSSWGTMIAAHPDKPLKLAKCDDVTTWLGTPIVQRVLCTFGTQFKKTKSFNDQGVHNSPMLPKQGKEEADEVFSRLAAQLPEKDISKILPSFKNTCWLWGQAASWPKTEVLPSAAGQMRLQFMGSLSLIMVDAAGFVSALEDSVGSGAARVLGHDAALAALQDMKQEDLARYKSKGCTFYRADVQASEVLWVPAGFLVSHRAEGALSYGLRKSYFTDNPATKKSIAAIAKLLRAESRPAARLDELVALFS